MNNYEAHILIKIGPTSTLFRYFNAIIAISLTVFVAVDFGIAYQRRWNEDERSRTSHIAHIGIVNLIYLIFYLKIDCVVASFVRPGVCSDKLDTF